MPAPLRFAREQKYCGYCCDWIHDAGASCPKCGHPLRWGPWKHSEREDQAAEKPAITATE